MRHHIYSSIKHARGLYMSEINNLKSARINLNKDHVPSSEVECLFRTYFNIKSHEIIASKYKIRTILDKLLYDIITRDICAIKSLDILSKSPIDEIDIAKLTSELGKISTTSKLLKIRNPKIKVSRISRFTIIDEI